MERKKVYLILILIGIILSALGPILGIAFDKTTSDQGSKKIDEESMNSFTYRYSHAFRLGADDTCYIEFSNYYPNITVYLIILTRNEFEYYYSVNGSSPTTGETFILYQRYTGGSISYSSLTSVTIAWSGSTYGNYVFLEFRGDGRVSIPGDYYVVVRGTNNYAGNDYVRFDIKVNLDGPGEIIENIFIWSGIALIAVVSLVWIYMTIKKGLGGR